MSWTVRQGQPSDIDGIMALCRRRQGHQVVIHDVPARVRMQQRLALYRESRETIGREPTVPVFVAQRNGRIEGYIVLVLGTKESITNEAQAVIYDFAVSDVEPAQCLSALLEAACELACAQGEQYVVVNLYEGVPQEEELFAALAFFADMVRIGKRVTTVPPSGLDAAGYRVRVGGPNDKLFVLNLNTQAAPFTIPPNRGRDPMEIGQQYYETYASLDLSPDNPLLKLLIAEEVSTHRSVGQIMLKLGARDVNDAVIAYIYDIAVHPEHMGRHLALLLVHEAELLLTRLGICWLIADISATNPRPLSLSLKYLGFCVHYRRWVRRL